MIRKILTLGVIAGLVACGSPAEQNQDAEEHNHEHGTEEMDEHNHDHGEATAVEEDRLVVAEGANVFFVNLKDGDVVSSPVTVEMGVTGMEVVPAGEFVEGTGHHHILINNEDGFHSKGTTVPADENNIHFGKGQTSTELELAPGEYRISLQFANGFHESYGEQMSASVMITVE